MIEIEKYIDDKGLFDGRYLLLHKFSDGVEGNYLNYNSDDMKIRVVYQISSNLIQFIQR